MSYESGSRIGEPFRGYYLTAYAIAVKHGFSGTEEEWIRSLSAYGIAVKHGYVGTEEEWVASLKLNFSDLTDEEKRDIAIRALNAASEEAVEAILAAKDVAVSASSTALEAAEDAQTAATSAGTSANAAQTAATSAAASSASAAESATTASMAESAASTYADEASASATSAAESASSADSSASEAESAKETASSAASAASEYATNAEASATTAENESALAQTAATSASTSASAAALSASAASASETSATASSASAAESAASAAESATTASMAESAAGTYASDASASATSAQESATSAAASASAASELVSRVADAVEGAERVNIAAHQTATGADITVTNRSGVSTTVHVDTFPDIDTWDGVQELVRAGRASRLFPLGYQFEARDSSTNKDIVWRVTGHDHHFAADGSLTHTMTLETKYTYSDASGAGANIEFDAHSAFYYTQSGLAAGTYHFTVREQGWYDADNGKNFQFTLSSAVPAGGQLVFDNVAYTQTLAGQHVASYASGDSLVAIETVTMSLGSSGQYLGATDGSGNCNHMYRALFSSNNYAQSSLRRWLNDTGGTWNHGSKFSRKSTVFPTENFTYVLPSDFLSAVQPAVVPCRTNASFETSSLDGTTFPLNSTYELHDKFFIPSRPEIFGDWDDPSVKDGTQMPFYVGMTAAERIKRSANGTALASSCIRSPLYWHPLYEECIDTSGNLTHIISAGIGSATTICCIIA